MRRAPVRLRKEAKQMSYPTIESTIGNTPLILLPRIGGEEAKRRNNLILGKLEGNNPEIGRAHV